jgi:large conductance mechanosensitive channel
MATPKKPAPKTLNEAPTGQDIQRLQLLDESLKEMEKAKKANDLKNAAQKEKEIKANKEEIEARAALPELTKKELKQQKKDEAKAEKLEAKQAKEEAKQFKEMRVSKRELKAFKKAQKKEEKPKKEKVVVDKFKTVDIFKLDKDGNKVLDEDGTPIIIQKKVKKTFLERNVERAYLVAKNGGGKTFREFFGFINRGNAVQLAIALIMSTAFTAIVNSLVGDIIMPIFGALFGQAGTDNIGGLFFEIKGIKIFYGKFLIQIITFLLMALVLFVIIKIVMSIIKLFHRIAKVDKDVTDLTKGAKTTDQKALLAIQALLEKQEARMAALEEEQSKGKKTTTKK